MISKPEKNIALRAVRHSLRLVGVPLCCSQRVLDGPGLFAAGHHLIARVPCRVSIKSNDYVGTGFSVMLVPEKEEARHPRAPGLSFAGKVPPSSSAVRRVMQVPVSPAPPTSVGLFYSIIKRDPRSMVDNALMRTSPGEFSFFPKLQRPINEPPRR
jgi:hypothetical protein